MDIIVTGHGHFATGLSSTIQLLAGELPHVHYVDFTKEMSEENLVDQLKSIMVKDKSYVFFCDLVGGTPYKEAARLSAADDKRIGVVAGCNLASLLEVGISLADSDNDVDYLTEELVTISQKGTQVFKVKPIKQEVIEDGI